MFAQDAFRRLRSTPVNRESLPPIPIIESSLIEDVIGYATAVLDPAKRETRWTVALEVLGPEAAAGDDLRRLIVVSLRVQCHQLFALLPESIQEEMSVPAERQEWERRTLAQLYRKMSEQKQSAWFLPIHRLGGAIVFLCKHAEDPLVKPILEFNEA